MRLATVATVIAALTLALPAPADAEVVNCGAYESLGALTCTTTGPAMIDRTEFVGDGSSAAQWQWMGSTTVNQAGTLRLSYTYTKIYNTLYAKIGIRLTVSQPTCDEGYESRRNWVDPATMDGVPAEVSVAVGCPGRVAYRITSRAATYSTGGSYIGRLSEANLSFAGSHEATSSRLASGARLTWDGSARLLPVRTLEP